MEHVNPAKLFLRAHGSIEDYDDLMQYVKFLRHEAVLGIEPPIDLTQIYARFCIPTPKQVPLMNDLHGLLVNPERGLILINADDPATRQRFSEAHELMEMLFDLLPRGKGWREYQAGNFKKEAKERLCNEGAAELLMPQESFFPRINHLGISYQTACELAREYNVSTTAALVQMVRIGPGHHAVVLFRMKNKPIELKAVVPDNQIPMFDDLPKTKHQKKLRVEWVLSSPNAPYIPLNKSIPEDSSIYSAWQTGAFVAEENHLKLGATYGRHFCECYPFDVGGERQVLALFHLPGDAGCNWR